MGEYLVAADGEMIARHEAVAKSIGERYQLARTTQLQTIQYLVQCGEHLQAQKAALPHGEWLLWVRQHQHLLGFDDRMARRMMEAARIVKSDVTTDLDETAALQISRRVWGNEPQVAELAERPPGAYLARFVIWTAKHSVDEFLGQADPAAVQAALTWLQQLAARLEQRREAA